MNRQLQIKLLRRLIKTKRKEEKIVSKLKKAMFYTVLLFTLVLSMPVQAQAAMKINKKSVTLTVGKSTTLKVKGTKKKVKWSSSKESVATVNQKGNVVAKKPGTAKITAKIGKNKFTCKVTVKKNSGKVASGSGNSSAAYVWLSATGEKYHRIPNCGKMNPNKARKVSLKEAQARGFDACDKCF